jgi:hypothetical protein
MSSVLTGILVFLACMAAPWALGCVIPLGAQLWRLRGGRIRVEPATESVALGAFPPPLQKKCDEVGRALESIGFALCGYATVDGLAPPEVEMVQAVWEDRSRGDTAVFTGFLLPAPAAGAQRPAAFDITIVSAYGCRRRAQTTTHPLADSVLHQPDLDVLYCPRIVDVRRLVAVHRARPRPAGWGRPQVDPPCDVATYCRRSHEATIQYARDAGHFEPDGRDPTSLRFTWRGLWSVAVRTAPPWRQRLLRRTRNRARDVLRQLGFDETGEPLSGVTSSQ